MKIKIVRKHSSRSWYEIGEFFEVEEKTEFLGDKEVYILDNDDPFVIDIRDCEIL